MSDSLESQIKKQIEFYFSDSNFRHDTFLKAAAESDPEGFVPISVLLTFNRLKKLSNDEILIANSVKGSDVVIVNDDMNKIRKAQPLSSDDNSNERTLYVKGFPLNDADVTIESIKDQFALYGPVSRVRLRKDSDTKNFKGSAFVEYESPEYVEIAYKAAYNEGDTINCKLEYKGTPFLCILPFTLWAERKAAKYKKLKSRDTAGSKRKSAEEHVEFTPGLIVKLSNLSTTLSLFEIKDKAKTIADVKFVEYKTGEDFAFIRFPDTSSVEKFMIALKDGLSIGEGNSNISGSLINGEEEVNYWKKIQGESKKKTSGKSKRFQGNGKFKNKKQKRD